MERSCEGKLGAEALRGLTADANAQHVEGIGAGDPIDSSVKRECSLVAEFPGNLLRFLREAVSHTYGIREADWHHARVLGDQVAAGEQLFALPVCRELAEDRVAVGVCLHGHSRLYHPMCFPPV